jgi:hypothetical protein
MSDAKYFNSRADLDENLVLFSIQNSNLQGMGVKGAQAKEIAIVGHF